MRTIKELSKAELSKILEEFYHQFETGYDFEEFLKPFLESIGLSEVEVTSKSGDGGIDLKAVKNGLVELNNNDFVKYKVQAKRYKPSTTMPPEKIDALRGTLLTNEKGLFITTSHVSDKAKNEALTKDPHRPVIVIDGLDLVSILIDKGIGFSYMPVFSGVALSEFMNRDSDFKEVSMEADETKDYVFKMVTANDIRARIISIPSTIVNKLENNESKHNVKVVVNGTKEYEVTFSPARKYLGGVTQLLKDFNFVKEDKTFQEKKIGWLTDGKAIKLIIEK